jgi:hypothetical protein
MSNSNKRSMSSTASDVVELAYPAENLYFIEKLNEEDICTVEIPDASTPTGKRASKPYNVVSIDIKGQRVVVETWADSAFATQKYLR